MKESELDGHNHSKLASLKINDVQKAFEDMLRDESVPLSDGGVINMDAGQVKDKRFKFFNDKSVAQNLYVVSNMPHVAEITTENVDLEVEQEVYIKFKVKAPLTPCNIHLYIALVEKDSSKGFTVEEIFGFKLEVKSPANL